MEIKRGNREFYLTVIGVVAFAAFLASFHHPQLTGAVAFQDYLESSSPTSKVIGFDKAVQAQQASQSNPQLQNMIRQYKMAPKTPEVMAFINDLSKNGNAITAQTIFIQPNKDTPSLTPAKWPSGSQQFVQDIMGVQTTSSSLNVQFTNPNWEAKYPGFVSALKNS